MYAAEFTEDGVIDNIEELRLKFNDDFMCDFDFFIKTLVDVKFLSEDAETYTVIDWEKITGGNNWYTWRAKTNIEARKGSKYRQWKLGVLRRDDYICQKCGLQKKGNHAHHIKKFSLYIDERYDLANGITLCTECHKKEHGWKSNV